MYAHETQYRMSIFTVQSSFLTLRPSVKETPDGITIGPNVVVMLATLGLWLTQVRIMPARRRICVSRRTAWFFATAYTIEFADVWYVEYTHSSLGTGWGWKASGFGRYDELDMFSIALVTKDGRSHPVCTYRGEGAVRTGWTGVLLGDKLFDCAGTQEQESRQLAERLAEMLGVSIGKPLQSLAPMSTCPACGQLTSPYKPKCLYCGAPVSSAPSSDSGPATPHIAPPESAD